MFTDKELIGFLIDMLAKKVHGFQINDDEWLILEREMDERGLKIEDFFYPVPPAQN